MLKNSLEDVFNDTELFVRKHVKENKSKYLTYSTIDKDLSKSKVDLVNIKDNLDIRRNGFDDKFYSIVENYGHEFQEMLEFKIIYEDRLQKLQEKYQKIEKRTHGLATVFVGGVSAVALTFGIGYVASTYHIRLLDNAMLPVFIGPMIATVIMLKESWNHRVGNLLLKPYGKKMKYVLSSERDLKEEYLNKAKKYVNKTEHNLGQSSKSCTN